MFKSISPETNTNITKYTLVSHVNRKLCILQKPQKERPRNMTTLNK